MFDEELKQSNILIVDDQPEFREIFSAALKAGGYEVQTASSGIEAIVAAKQSPPALILCSRVRHRLTPPG